MGIVERLRETSCVFAVLEPEIAAEANQAADMIERLKGYAMHGPDCPAWAFDPDYQCACTCGLTALIKEIDNG